MKKKDITPTQNKVLDVLLENKDRVMVGIDGPTGCAGYIVEEQGNGETVEYVQIGTVRAMLGKGLLKPIINRQWYSESVPSAEAIVLMTREIHQ